MSAKHTEIAIVGAGIVGLAHALAAAKRGFKVTVFERNLRAIGASIRNFGMVWPIGQPAGRLRDRALKSREIWLDVAEKTEIYCDRCGSLSLAYHQDELDVLEEFISTNGVSESLSILSPAEVLRKSAAVNPDGLLGGLWSDTEMTVDPRQALQALPEFLFHTYGVEFEFGRAVTAIDYPNLQISNQLWSADRILVCSGADIETLYPDLYAESGITKVKLQMMRTAPQPNNWRLGPSLSAGLTLTHYAAFSECKSLDILKQRIEIETPHFPEWGIHVMASQNGLGELILGDSHEYGLTPDPFDRAEINNYILDYLRKFTNFPSLAIAETWHGVYTKLAGKTEYIASPEDHVFLINALSGAGMTLSFGLAEENMALL
ncbi:TIGR03364 family FAD-dependent oxidoreductase [Pseudanabaena sp. 'Roaring Creek']|uniref:TIGR03364 family FAD-dependent oxidoreductase n=1 Tax=Pseudanabaena sp. 'Roaring Creek' TaxID=1681830 RepID=UPI0006D78154|nr:TIGR03364 family FAD-dependent oxidoreductase [Pseudanabaena sp. 'Roaring Creek']